MSLRMFWGTYSWMGDCSCGGIGLAGVVVRGWDLGMFYLSFLPDLLHYPFFS